MNDPELSIVIPAYEEAESLSQVLPVLQAKAKSLTPNFEILVVDVAAACNDANAFAVQREFLSKCRRQRDRTGRLQYERSAIERRAHRHAYLVIGNGEDPVG